MRYFFYFFLGILLFTSFAGAFYAGRVYEATSPASENLVVPMKPIIYLYPEKETNVLVKILYQGVLTSTYPDYGNGWNVTAFSDGKIINSKDGKEYSYLFWEGESKKQVHYDWSKGFIVKGEDVRNFLQKVLSEKGLTPKEYNEFIVYWYPKLKDNKYNLIHFASEEEYDNNAPLEIQPKPQSMLRVFMVYKPLSESVLITAQEIKPFIRKGFTVIEWGGDAAKY